MQKIINVVEEDAIKYWPNELVLFPKPKLKIYLNKQHGRILKSLFEQDKVGNKKRHSKQVFVKEHFGKSYDKVLGLVNDKEINNEFFNYYENLILLLASYDLDEENFHRELEKINEKTSKQKSHGVYYTPEDVSSFIVSNVIAQYLSGISNDNPHPSNDTDSYINNLTSMDAQDACKKIALISMFDPACGTGSFLIKVVDIKFSLIEKIDKKNSQQYLYEIIENLFGNDVDSYSTYITKIRLLFKCLSLDSTINIKKIYDLLDSNFFNINIVSEYRKIKQRFDVVLGNPPYVEKTKVDYSDKVKYGNIYADVVHSSVDLIKDNGVVGMIIPISYISTKRMKPIRRYIEYNTNVQFILSYADRPDCLFSGVHQKLNILFAKRIKDKKAHVIFTADYKFWYKKQREHLFSNIEFVENTFSNGDFYPKLNNNIELGIYNKIIQHSDTIINLQSNDSNFVYLNKRSCFWTKSFIVKPLKDNEYGKYSYNKDYQGVCNCMLNSSLFWWFWVKVSDCWHITNKELNGFKIPTIDKLLFPEFHILSNEIENKLQATKKRVNTKQVLYEYKHKNCINEINSIDNLIAKVYILNKKEMEYIENYNQDYRLSK
jgi:hypothetical protein